MLEGYFILLISFIKLIFYNFGIAFAYIDINPAMKMYGIQGTNGRFGNAGEKSSIFPAAKKRD